MIIHYPAGHRATNGHFDNHPIIPGVMILSDVLGVIRAAHPEYQDATYNIRNAKFLQPVVPGESIEVKLRREESTVHFDCVRVDHQQTGEATAKGSFAFASPL
jgi:3-hydroxymyristoyl/3-hydroxydecanoyl-(acyl carrier protein) dehydratase